MALSRRRSEHSVDDDLNLERRRPFSIARDDAVRDAWPIARLRRQPRAAALRRSIRRSHDRTFRRAYWAASAKEAFSAGNALFG